MISTGEPSSPSSRNDRPIGSCARPQRARHGLVDDHAAPPPGVSPSAKSRPRSSGMPKRRGSSPALTRFSANSELAVAREAELRPRPEIELPPGDGGTYSTSADRLDAGEAAGALEQLAVERARASPAARRDRHPARARRRRAGRSRGRCGARVRGSWRTARRRRARPSASATCATTSAPRSRDRRAPPVPPAAVLERLARSGATPAARAAGRTQAGQRSTIAAVKPQHAPVEAHVEIERQDRRRPKLLQQLDRPHRQRRRPRGAAQATEHARSRSAAGARGGRARRRAPAAPRSRARAPTRGRAAGWRRWRTRSAAPDPSPRTAASRSATSRISDASPAAALASSSVGATGAPGSRCRGGFSTPTACAITFICAVA